jgi:hypothetical protein
MQLPLLHSHYPLLMADEVLKYRSLSFDLAPSIRRVWRGLAVRYTHPREQELYEDMYTDTSSSSDDEIHVKDGIRS